jgi:hypothetical protein
LAVDYIFWVLAFVAYTFFVYWFLFWGGDDTVLGLFLAGGDPRWSQAGLRVFVAGTWVVYGLWFLLGLFDPSLRLIPTCIPFF